MVRAMSPINISRLKELAGETPVSASVLAQLQSRATRKTKADKPYLELVFADSTGNFHLKIWSDSPAYQNADTLAVNDVFRLEGKWTQNSYGIDARDIRFCLCDEDS